MKLRILSTEFWKNIFGFKDLPSEVSVEPPKSEPMPEDSIQTKITKPPEFQPQKKFPNLTVRSELNLEQNSIFTVSTYRGKSREIIIRENTSTGETLERRAIIGKTADGVETGVLTTYHFKLYLALLELWEKEGKPIEAPVHFTILKIINRLGMADSGREYERVKKWLRHLRQIPLTFIDSFYIPEVAKHTNLADMTILSYLNIYERKNVGKTHKTRGYGEFQFDRHILVNLLNNHTHPLRLDVIRDFKTHKDLAILLYTYLDRNLAFKGKYEVGLEKLFNHLDLSQGYVKYPSDRKRVIEPVLGELRNKPLSTGTLSYCRVHKTENSKDYKLVCHKKPVSQRIEEGNTPFQLTFPTEPAEPKGLEPELLTLLNQKGLTQKQIEKLLSEKGEEVIKAQLTYLPFRLEEYKTQGKTPNSAAMLYDSIKDNWQPPTSYLNTEKENQKSEEREAKKIALQEEHKAKVKAAQAEVQEWENRPPEDRVKAPLDSWIWGQKQFEHRQPSDEEIRAKEGELISNLPTKEEYERRLISEIEAELQTELGKL